MSYSRIIAANLSTSGGPSGGGGNVSAFAGSPKLESSFSCNPPGVTIPRHLAGSCPAFVKPCATPLVHDQATSWGMDRCS